jgi:diacylglycerol kinase family enzyme
VKSRLSSSSLWFAIAAGLGATRNKWARRAALRGLGSMAIANAAAKLIATGIDRTPPGLAIPPPPGRPIPVASLRPDARAAHAAGFAAAVSLELPGLAVPISVLAIAAGAAQGTRAAAAGPGTRQAAASQAAPGRLAGVVAGFAVGAAAGIATLRWWPRRPMQPAQAVRPRRQVPALPTGDGVALVVNLAAGGVTTGLVDWLRAELPDATLVEAPQGGDLAELLRTATRGARVLGAAGGDGTLNTAADIALGAGLPLLVVPAGTLNHFAADLGVFSPRQAVAALRMGGSVLVDVGVADERPFLNTSSTGVYVDLVRARERLQPRIGKRPAGLLALVDVLRRGRPHDVIVDGTKRRLWLLFGGNCSYVPAGFAPSYRPNMADGLLDIRLIDAEPLFARTRLITSVITGTLGRSRVYHTWHAPAISLAVLDGHPAGLALDGEVTDAGSPIRIRKRPRQLLVYRLART